MSTHDLEPATPRVHLELRSPPLPQTLIAAIELMQDPEKLEIKPVVQMIERDPFVVARLIRIANSAFYRRRTEIKTVERAVVVVGPVATVGIIVGMKMLRLRPLFDQNTAKSFRVLLHHSLATAFLTRMIMEELVAHRYDQSHLIGQPGTGFTAGLLHDFGKLILLYNFPDDAAGFYEPAESPAAQDEGDILAREHELFGCNHVEAGTYLAEQKHFPADLSSIIQLHHQVDPEGVEPHLAGILRCVAAANMMAKAIGFATRYPVSEDECQNYAGWNTILPDGLDQDFKKALVARLLSQRGEIEGFINNMSPE